MKPTPKTSDNTPSTTAGPCAKTVVRCLIIITPDGQAFEGRNDCGNAQAVCPREPGEGYEKCKSICQQPGHAEEMALRAAAGADLKGATATLYGIGHFCKECQTMLFRAGVRFLELGNAGILQRD